MKLIWSGDYDGVHFLAGEHVIQVGEIFVDLQFGGGLPGSVWKGIGYGDEPRFRHQAAEIFGMALAHFSDSEHANS
jgi:hypothetical protein